MKIKVLIEIPVEENIRPKIGGIYDVVEVAPRDHGRKLYFIKVKGERVGVFDRECEIVQEAQNE